MAFSANSSSSSQTSEINVTPLIDVLLVLLIIFMVIVPITPRGLESSLPQGKASSPAVPPVTVRVLGTDPALPVLYRVDGRNVSAAELQPALRSLFCCTAGPHAVCGGRPRPQLPAGGGGGG